MKPTSRQRQQRAVRKAARRSTRQRKGRRAGSAPAALGEKCPKCGTRTPDKMHGAFVRCANCGSIKS